MLWLFVSCTKYSPAETAASALFTRIIDYRAAPRLQLLCLLENRHTRYTCSMKYRVAAVNTILSALATVKAPPCHELFDIMPGTQQASHPVIYVKEFLGQYTRCTLRVLGLSGVAMRFLRIDT